MDDKDLQSTARQIRHQMIALNNKDFVPACFYGLPGLHDGEQVQLSTFPYNDGALPGGQMSGTAILHTIN